MKTGLPRPVNKRVLVRPLPMPEKSEGGIFIPGSVREVFEDAVVVASASDVVKEGEIATYPQHLGVKLEKNGVDYKWLNDSEIWGVDEPR